MAIDSTAAEHFRAGREALVRQREDLDRAIQSIDRILAMMAGDGVQPPTARREEPDDAAVRRVTRRASLTNQYGSGQGAILNVMRTEPDRVWTPAEIHEALAAANIVWEYSTTRSTVAKMGRDGTLTRLGRGAYLVPSENAETPAGTGVSDNPTIHRSQEGGGSHETATETPHTAEDHVDPQLGASIAEAAR